MKNKDKARLLTLTNDVCLLYRNVFGFLSYVSTAAASHIIFWYLFESIYIYIYIDSTHVYIYIFILYIIYIFLYTLYNHTYVIFPFVLFPLSSRFIPIYLYMLSSTTPITIYTPITILHTYTHARTHQTHWQIKCLNRSIDRKKAGRYSRLRIDSLIRILIARMIKYLVDFFA